MSSSPDLVIKRLLATARTGKCENVFFRQVQLKTLHDVLRAQSVELQNALEADTSASTAEAAMEVAISLSTVKEHHASIDPKKELDEEYRIAKGENAVNQRNPWGVVYIEPQLRHTPLFCVLAPLSAAVLAGNAVAIKFEDDLLALTSLLRKLLPQALDRDTFAIVSASPSSEALDDCMEVLQDSTISNLRHSQLVSRSTLPVIAIVDRSADLASAAQSLVTARFAFGGSSPYAPDVVLVNEFVAKPFLDLAMQFSVRFLGKTSTPASKERKDSAQNSQDGHDLQPSLDFEYSVYGSGSLASRPDIKAWRTSHMTQGDAGAVIGLVPIASGSERISKLSKPILAVSKITSPDHAIDLVTRSGPFSAAYYFAEPAHAKYLAQFIAADVSFTNHVPMSILLGPSAPLYATFDMEKRYLPEHFTKAKPAYVRASVTQERLEAILGGKDAGLAKSLLMQATVEIKEAKRPESIANGFFENGIFIGLGIYGVPILSFICAVVSYGVRYGLKMWLGSV